MTRAYRAVPLVLGWMLAAATPPLISPHYVGMVKMATSPLVRDPQMCSTQGWRLLMAGSKLREP